jgi:hypothetical protein
MLTPEALVRLLTEALRRQQAGEIVPSIADRVAEADVEPMSMDEITSEVEAFRAERQRAGGH